MSIRWDFIKKNKLKLLSIGTFSLSYFENYLKTKGFMGSRFFSKVLQNTIIQSHRAIQYNLNSTNLIPVDLKIK